MRASALSALLASRLVRSASKAALLPCLLMASFSSCTSQGGHVATGVSVAIVSVQGTAQGCMVAGPMAGGGVGARQHAGSDGNMLVLMATCWV